MRLEVGCFNVKAAKLGEKTTLAGGVLTVDGNELAALIGRDGRLGRVEVAVANPGERVRIANIMDIAEPRVKAGGQLYYPGMAGPLYRAGAGGTIALKGAAVMEIGAMEGFNGGVVDMAGEGASLTPHSRTVNVCLVMEPASGTGMTEYGRALKRAGLTASIYLASAAAGSAPDEVEVFDLDRGRAGSGELPAVAYLMQLHSHGESREPFIYGDNTRRYYPTVLHPNEILDGAVVCGHYNISFGLKNSTYTLVNHPVIRGLFRRHGKEVDFRGVVVSPEPTSLSEIQRTSMMAAGLLKETLGAEGVIITKEGGGHTDVDLMENCNACEGLGMKTVLVDNEWLGPDGAGEFPLLSVSPSADAMVSVGNVDALVPLRPMDRIIGGARLLGGFAGDLSGPVDLPIWFVPNAVSQAGLTYLSTEGR